MYNPSATSNNGLFGFDQSKFSETGRPNLGYLFGPTLLNFYYDNMFTPATNVTNISKRDGYVTAIFSGSSYNDIS
jgi:hypothetical protein